jgi:hypothetical protein
MNYYVQYNNDLLDYSDGRNGPPYDQNDWEKIFVPSFQYNGELVEEIFFEPPGLDKIVSGETEFGVKNYAYDEELTNQFVDRVGSWSPVDPIEANWLVFKYENEGEGDHQSSRNVKIYTQPRDVPYAGYILYGEGTLDSDKQIQFYSQDALIKEIFSDISQ